MVIKDIIYVMVVALFTVACWLQAESVPRGFKLLPLGLSTWGLLLLVGSRWNMFHMEPDCLMPRNNLSYGIKLNPISLVNLTSSAILEKIHSVLGDLVWTYNVQ